MEYPRKSLQRIAQERWLTPEEIYEILMTANVSNSQQVWHQLPQNGQVFIFDRAKFPNFKDDGIEWVKKKSTNAVQEQYLKLLINGVHAVTGQYTTSAIDNNFRRRCYRLTDVRSTVTLVHYRNIEGDAYSRNKTPDRRRSDLSTISAIQKEGSGGEEEQNGPSYVPFDMAEQGGKTGLMTSDSGDNSDLHFLRDIFGPGSMGGDFANAEDYSDIDYEMFNRPAEETGAVEAAVTAAPLPTIVDFSPCIDISGGCGGTKVLLCLSGPVPVSTGGVQVEVHLTSLSSSLVEVVSAELLTHSVVRFHTPPLRRKAGSHSQQQKFTLTVATEHGMLMSEPSAEPLSYEVPLEFQQVRLSKKRPSGTELPTLSSTTNEADTHSHQKQYGSSAGAASAMDDSRIHKIRIVERLLHAGGSTMGSGGIDGIRAEGMVGGSCRPMIVSHSDDGWLDDNMLSSLSTSDLEKLMDQFLVRVVQQLVQFATLDEDLKAELDHLDSCGYSLLHYCSLFNLTSLVPRLIEKGADVNLLTECGSSALHLAAASGHGMVVEQLANAGADIYSRDASGRTPADLAANVFSAASMHTYRHFLWPDDVTAPLEQGIAGESNTSCSPAPCLSQPSPKRDFNSHTFDWAVHCADMDDECDSSIINDFKDIVDADHHPSAVPATLCRGWQSGSSPHVGHSNASSSVTSPTHSIPPDLLSPAEGNGERVSTIALLHGALAALSLTDKCALSLSLGGSGPGNRTPLSEDFEVRSVLGETDKESLDLAMSMMGPQELNAVEEEVRRIQSNVRTWLLRKNYTNLRDAARTLQVAWRERRAGSSSRISRTGTAQRSHSGQQEAQGDDEDEDMGEVEKVEGFNSRMEVSTEDMEEVDGRREEHEEALKQDELRGERRNRMRHEHVDSCQVSNSAASILQRATRGMLARKSFRRVKQQAMASLVIQKSLFMWWVHKGNAHM